jgi:two-component system NarL family response regulator
MQMKLLLVDDHLLFMESLQYLLQTYNIEVVGKASNGKEAIEIARELSPDIILMDIRMPGYSGLEALKQIKGELPDIKIIMLTTSDEDEDLYDAIKYGASGYLLKSTDAKELINILEQVMNNEAFISPNLALRLLSEFRHKENEVKQGSRNLNSYLTDRQIEILEMVAKGITYKEVGETIGLTERTVKYHMGRILEQLHLENRSQVIAFASLGGLFDNK